MNARVSLLVLVVFTFMAIWDADRQGKAMKSVHAPQPMNWHLPLPAPGDELATMATPILPSPADVQIAMHEVSGADSTSESTGTPVHVEPTVVTEENFTEQEMVTIEETQVESVASQTSPAPAEKTEPVEETVSGPATPSITVEISEPVVTETIETDAGATPVSLPVNESVPLASEIPENLQVVDPAMNERILNLSRSALAIHEQNLRPINPELTPDDSEEHTVQSMPVVDTLITESKADEVPVAGTPNADGQTVSEKSGEAAVEYLPVPRDLASGTWQLISQDGEMIEITITRSEQTASEQPVRNKYAVGVNAQGKRWAFIRVEKSAVADSSKSEPQKPDAVPEPARPVQKAATEFFSPTAR